MKLVMTQANLTMKGGAERVVLKIAQHYKAPVYVAEYDKSKTFEEFGDLDVRVIAGSGNILPYGRAIQGLRYGLSFYNYKMDEDYDVINAHIAPSHWIRNRNERVLWYCHTPLRDIYDLYDYRMSLKKPHQKIVHGLGASVVKRIDQGVVRNIESIFANSKNTKARISKYLHRDDAMVLGGGIDYKKYFSNGTEKYFFYPSRISPNKRQDYVIRAFKAFRRNKAAKGYKLMLAGSVSKDPFYHNYYLEMVRMIDGDPDIKVLVDVTEERLRDLYSKAAGVLYAPVNEDYGLVPLEAMASKKPIIAVNEGGPKETIINGKTGFLVNNETEMAERMAWVAEKPSLANAMGRNGRKLVEKKHSWAAFFREFDRGLKKVSMG